MSAADGDELTVEDVPPSGFSWSSGGGRRARSARLSDPDGVWTAGGAGRGEYLQLLLGAGKGCGSERCVVHSVATEGHPNGAAYVSRYYVEASRDLVVWARYPPVGWYEGHQQPSQAVLAPPGRGVEACAVRFVIDAFVGTPSMRVGVWFHRHRTPGLAALAGAYKALVNSDTYPDVNIVVRAAGSRMNITAHRAVLSARSPFFRRALAKAMKEQQNPRAVTLYIDNVETGPMPAASGEAVCRRACEVVQAVLVYLYSGEPPPAHLAHPVTRTAHTLGIEDLAALTQEELFVRAAAPGTCIAAYVSAAAEGRPDVARLALGTIAQHWRRLHEGFPWDELGAAAIQEVLAAVNSARPHRLVGP